MAAQKAQVPVTLVDSSQASLDKGIAFAGWWKPELAAIPNLAS